jgi:ABC-type uncharacterized transport system fused permease/ATPase subunit
LLSADECELSFLVSCWYLQRAGTDLKTLATRFWKVAAPYWWSEDKTQARLRLAAVFALTLGTTGISVGFNFLGRDFYNALAGTVWCSVKIVTHTHTDTILYKKKNYLIWTI